MRETAMLYQNIGRIELPYKVYTDKRNWGYVKICADIDSDGRKGKNDV